MNQLDTIEDQMYAFEVSLKDENEQLRLSLAEANADFGRELYRAEAAEAEIKALEKLVEAQAKDHASNNIRLAENAHRADIHQAEIERLRAALREIQTQDIMEIALDPDWPRRIARAALEGENT